VSHSEPEVSGRYQATIGTSLVTPKPQDNSRGPKSSNYGDWGVFLTEPAPWS